MRLKGRWAAMILSLVRAACLLGCGWCAAMGAPAAFAGQAAHRLQPPPAIAPSARIAVEPLGFRPPSRFYLAYRVPSATLDFVDDTHLLFTFHSATLMHREEKEPEDDEDQTIAAVLLEVPSGKVVERTTWRLHDKGRYLWALGRGRFLERERNTLYLLDHSVKGDFLAQRVPYLRPEGELVSVQFSPGRNSMVVEYREAVEEAKSSAQSMASAPTLGDVPRRPAHRVHLLVVDTEAGKVEKSAELPHAVALPLIAGGYLDVEQGKGRLWDVVLKPFGGEPRKLVEVTSLCQPEPEALSEQVFLTQLCIPYTSDHLMQAYDLDGHKLWEQQWEGRYVWGSFDYAVDGSRFAYESIQLDHPITSLDPVDDNAMTGQPVGVFDVANGGLRLVSGADPILSAGQNYALSADGEHFAVLRNGAIEVYKLPPAAVR